MNNMKHIVPVIILLFLALPTYLCAQQDTVILNRDTTLTTCDLMLYDSGGEDGHYSSNENYVLTVCGTGTNGMVIDVISLITERITLDYISIYEGESMNSDFLVANLGGRVEDSLIILESNCVTIRFHSDGSVNRDGFVIRIHCQRNCQEYSQNILYDDIYEEVHLICNSSSIVSNPIFYNNNVEYEQTIENTFFRWNVINENRKVSGMGLNTLDSLSPGMHLIELTIFDNAHCITNSGPMLFMEMDNPEITFSGIPEVASMYDTLVISGEITTGDEYFFNYNTLAYGCITNLETTAFTNIVHRFPEDAVITTPDDIESICVEMEHSFLGDIEVGITCPNGQRMTLFTQCGNRTFLGEPIAYRSGFNREQDPECMPGEPYMYCWTRDAAMTIPQQSNECPRYTYTDLYGNVHNDQRYIPGGDYLPTGNWTNLVGCPMNGVWTLNVNDQGDFDEGFVFSFSVQFEADSIEVSTDSIMYTQVFSEEDFSWNGQGIISGQNGSSTMVVSSEEPGLQTYTFSVVNNYGCTYDTTFSIFFCNPDFTETYITECDSAVFYGIVYHESGDYMVNAACGNEEMLHISIGHTKDTTITVSNCDEYVWNDEIFTESGTYTRHFQGFVGCDSIVTLDLTIKNSVEYEFWDTSCGPYEWDGTMYTETALHQRIYPAANGCDSIVTLHLVVYESETIDTTLEVPCCQYEMNGYTYTEPGNYIQVLTTINGCDSIIQLSLVFTDSITTVDDYRPTGTMLFPNPANNEINVVSEDLISKVEIITPIGMVVIAEEVDTKSIYLDISDLSAGGYFAVVWFKDNQNPMLLGFVKQ